jgi:N-acetyl-gamma-glutamyl-phosphate reductase
VKVAVVGASGYGGVELIRLIEQHPSFELGAVFSSSQPGQLLRSVYPPRFVPCFQRNECGRFE